MKRNDYRLPDHLKEDFFKHKPEWMKRIACGCYSLGDVREAMEYVLAVTNECDDLGRETAKLIERLKLIPIKKEYIMEEKKTIKEWKEAFADLYKAMRKELGASDLDVRVCQNDVKPVVNFDIKF